MHWSIDTRAQAIYYRVPVVAFPAMLDSDQPRNAQIVQQLNVGRRLNRANLSFSHVADTVTAVATDASIRTSISHYAAVLQSQGGAGRAAHLIETAVTLGVDHLVLHTQPAVDVWAALLFVMVCVWWLLRRCCARYRGRGKAKVE